LSKLTAAAQQPLPVLLLGETGSGKEMCARLLHDRSPRQDTTFLPVDCTTIPDELFESELFGHTRGAFTHAVSKQQGLVSACDRGTLFLDEVQALSLRAQGKLLRFLEERKYRPLGRGQWLNADVRIIAATNQDLAAAVQQATFRRDLYYRLNVLTIVVPPLRDRVEDIEPLARHFLALHAASVGQAAKTLSGAALAKLRSYPWPGNVRELRGVIQRAATFVSAPMIEAAAIDLPLVAQPASVPKNFSEAREEAIRRWEADYIRSLLEKNGGNMSRAAAEAVCDRANFRKKAKKHGL
jgi:DNA-binding NtrC family response regulator